MKLAGNASCFPNHQHQHQYIFELQVGQAFAQVEAHITNEGINLTDVPALMTVLEMAFSDPDHLATVEQKLGMLKQTIRDFSTYCAEFQHYTTNV
jgi:DNA repair ATPase RecN